MVDGWVGGWVDCCKVAYASAFTEDINQTRHNCL
jgi:hypothetical protein